MPGPAPGAPRIWLRAEAGGRDAAAAQVRQALLAQRPAPVLPEAPAGPPPLHEAPAALARWLDAARPDAILSLFEAPPRTVLDAAEARGLPVVLADAAVAQWPVPPLWQRLTGAGALARLTRVLVPDAASLSAALRRGVAPERLAISGTLTETRPPLGCSQAELAMQARALGGRPCWFVVALPAAEERQVLIAHQAMLGLLHRALLLVQPADPARAAHLLALFEGAGLHAALRSQQDEPAPEHQVLILDEPGETGLWYRLAPVTLLGGTLSGEDGATRHPFEAAGLGSAILHGPVLHRHAEGWRQLERAGASHLVPRGAALADHLLTVIEPERAADLASRAWTVCTGGAVVAAQIAQAAIAAATGAAPTPRSGQGPTGGRPGP